MRASMSSYAMVFVRHLFCSLAGALAVLGVASCGTGDTVHELSQRRMTRVHRNGWRCALAAAGMAAVGSCAETPHYDSIEIHERLPAATDECRVSTPPQHYESLTLGQQGDYPCRVAAVRSGIELRPSPDAVHPDPAFSRIIRDGRGRFVTAATGASGRGTFLVWNPDGSFLTTVGRAGGGPGEFPGESSPRPWLGRGDSIYARAGPFYSVFGPDLVFARRTTHSLASAPVAIHITEDGTFLFTEPVLGSDTDFWFHEADPDGRLVRSFGRVTAGQRVVPLEGLGNRKDIRVSAYGGDRTFWVAPPAGAPDGYVLEEWSLDGELLRTIRRDVPWLQPQDLRPEGTAEFEGAVYVMTPMPFFSVVHLDDQHRLWVVIEVKSPRWRAVPPLAPNNPPANERYDLRYEVIDPAAGAVLASGVLDEYDATSAPPIRYFIGNTSLSYRSRVDALGLQTIEIFRMVLVDNNGR